MSDPRGRLLMVALGFAGLPRPSYDRAVWALRFWLDSWRGIGDVERGMERQGFDLQLTRYDEKGWRATFYCHPGRCARRAAKGRGEQPMMDSREGPLLVAFYYLPLP